MIDPDVPGTVAEVIGNQDPVIADLHQRADRITALPTNLEHLV